MEKDFITKLDEHLEQREWSDEQRIGLYQILGRSVVGSAEIVLNVLEYQQGTDEQIEAEREFDRWAVAREFSGQDTLPLDKGWDVT